MVEKSRNERMKVERDPIIAKRDFYVGREAIENVQWPLILQNLHLAIRAYGSNATLHGLFPID